MRRRDLAAAAVLLAFALFAIIKALGLRFGTVAAGARRSAVAGTLVSLLIYALVLEWLGFLLATFALLLFFFRTLQRQSWLVVVTGSLATSLLSYLVFKTWLGVNLPGGLLGF